MSEETPTPQEESPPERRGKVRHPFRIVRAAISATAESVRPGEDRIFWATVQLAQLVKQLGLATVLVLVGTVYFFTRAPTSEQTALLAAAVAAQGEASKVQTTAITDAIDRGTRTSERVSLSLDASANAQAEQTKQVTALAGEIKTFGAVILDRAKVKIESVRPVTVIVQAPAPATAPAPAAPQKPAVVPMPYTPPPRKER